MDWGLPYRVDPIVFGSGEAKHGVDVDPSSRAWQLQSCTAYGGLRRAARAVRWLVSAIQLVPYSRYIIIGFSSVGFSLFVCIFFTGAKVWTSSSLYQIFASRAVDCTFVSRRRGFPRMALECFISVYMSCCRGMRCRRAFR